MISQFLDFRSTLGIATWNARIFKNQGSYITQAKLIHILYEMRRLDIDVMGISETRWTGSGWFSTELPEHNGYLAQKFHIFYHGQNKTETTSLESDLLGLALILSKKAMGYFRSYDCGRDDDSYKRAMAVELGEILVIQLHAPQNANKDYREEMKNWLGKRSEKQTIIMGALNETKPEDKNKGKKGLHAFCSQSMKTKEITDDKEDYKKQKADYIYYKTDLDVTEGETNCLTLLASDHAGGLVRGKLAIGISTSDTNLPNKRNPFITPHTNDLLEDETEKMALLQNLNRLRKQYEEQENEFLAAMSKAVEGMSGPSPEKLVWEFQKQLC